MKIVCEFDTVSKTLSVMADGKMLDNVESVRMGQWKNYDGEMVASVNLTRCGADKENKTMWCETTCASLKDAGVSVEEKSTLEKDLVSYFKG